VSVTARELFESFVDLLLPRRCVQCGRAGRWLCAECVAQLRRLDGPGCRRCGCPDVPPAQSCPECAGRDLAFASAGAAFAYEGPARRLVTACKFGALRSVVAEMAALAAPCLPLRVAVAVAGMGDVGGFDGAGITRSDIAGADPAAIGTAAAVDLVTCVPAHRGHKLERGFNQAELLARDLARAAGLPFAPLLVRTRHGRRQSGLAKSERAANVRGAFALVRDARRVAAGAKRVLVMDDVFTTGETLNQCSSMLVAAGLEPHVFTFARTVRAARL
jgi:predicted amidophosphoribosyltransferase